ncbi:2-succinyl-6-hydroxy-2,4-cyclohexadiene-1-carboxylate synthase [Sansalvadorimonas sp. 2012CJ34-2]|uniref:Putative 2-succinyl-6-hydroxy-2,4-cyclohexadiene-1-carboxylate synthase n=1 Tax=Parendozoicomonas callyspongiae TaxID=2942213 RepID=A0ABT0PEI1_9GAMM|nr:2-succinyl-6-hydroxy-2,4-cyclohexadiene-1-carboxylate synthase [Sansalvadorimonas sp. 2012CJ34-2]MCL6269441.1 2-succinyl-6-hydroxy-2,4-cyclohexadiene-1-carboxylate synthase [Sansalvadorimonas sp. 2012CJ34-2]
MLSHGLSLVDHGGQGSPLILLHGFLGSGDDWLSVLPELKNKYHCYTIDLPGHGSSGGFSDEISAEADAFAGISDRVHRLLSEEGLLPATVMGYSLGGRIALGFASHYPDDVELLILEGANPGLKTERERQERIDSDSRWSQRFRAEPLKDVLKDWYRQPVFSSLTEEQRNKLVKQRSIDNDGSLLADAMDLLSLGRQSDWWHVSSQLTCNVVYIVGERDNKFLAIAEALKKEAFKKNGKVCKAVVADAGHNAHRDNPKDFLVSLFSAECLKG